APRPTRSRATGLLKAMGVARWGTAMAGRSSKCTALRGAPDGDDREHDHTHDPSHPIGHSAPRPRGGTAGASIAPMEGIPPSRHVRRMGRLTESTEEGLLTYGDYLKVPELLSLQQLRSDPAVHDEHLFIVVHQAYELWFKQLLFELGSIRDRMIGDEPERARHQLTRVHAIERVLIEHIEVLQTMTPQDFLAFRTHLAPASGFQSVQFREIEFVSGLKDARYIEDLASSPEERARLE